MIAALDIHWMLACTTFEYAPFMQRQTQCSDQGYGVARCEVACILAHAFLKRVSGVVGVVGKLIPSDKLPKLLGPLVNFPMCNDRTRLGFRFNFAGTGEHTISPHGMITIAKAIHGTQVLTP
jgi:hypothetical protein